MFRLRTTKSLIREKESRQHALIFYCISLDKPTSLRNLLSYYEYINRSTPLREELSASLGWLIARGFVTKQEKDYYLTNSGKELRKLYDGESIWDSIFKTANKFKPFIEKTATKEPIDQGEL